MFNPADILQAAKKPKRGGHSALYWALWDGYAVLAPELNRHAVNWQAMTEAIGVTDGRGNKPSARTFADTWRKVDRRKREGRKRRKKRVERSRLGRAFRRSAR